MTIWRIGRPLDKTLGLAGIRKKSRPKTAQQLRNDAAKQRSGARGARTVRRSSDLEVAVSSVCAHCGHFFSSQCFARRNEEAEQRAYREKHTVKFYSYTEVPNLQLLSVNGPRSADMPRHALTTQSGLCLQPAACRMDGADLIIALCDDCHKDLERAHIPLTSLVYVDTGGIPKSPVPELNLASLTTNSQQHPETSSHGYRRRSHKHATPSRHIHLIHRQPRAAGRQPSLSKCNGMGVCRT